MSHLIKRRARGPIHHFPRKDDAKPVVVQTQLNGTMTLPAPLKIDVSGLKTLLSWIAIALLLLVILATLTASNLAKLVDKPTTVEVKNTMRIPYGFSVPNSERPDMLYRPQTSKQYNI